MKCPHCKSDNVIGYTDLARNSYRCINCKKDWAAWEEKKDPKKFRNYDLTEYKLLYDFAFDMYGHEDTAKAKVEMYLKNKNEN